MSTSANLDLRANWEQFTLLIHANTWIWTVAAN